MRIIKPCFYDEFKCIADKCSLNCCKKWTIGIDGYAYEKYMNIDGELGKKLKDNIIKNKAGNGYEIKLDDNNICPFQDENGLCEIVKEKGADYLSYTCTKYPRGIVGYADAMEMSLSPSCPAVVDFFYEYEYLTFPEEENDENYGTEFDEIDVQAQFDADLTNVFISMIQVDEVPLWIKQYLILRLADSIKEPYLNRDYDKVAEITEKYTNINAFAEYSAAVLQTARDNLYAKYTILKSMRIIVFDADLTEMLEEDSIADYENMDCDTLRKHEMQFNSEVYKKIEYVIENFCANEMYSNVKKGLNKYYIYENLAIIFLHVALIKYCMFIYWLVNGKKITKNDEIKIIASTSRVFYHNPKNAINICKENGLLIKPNNMLIILKD